MTDVVITISGDASDAEAVLEQLKNKLEELQGEQKQATAAQRESGNVLTDLAGKAKGLLLAYGSFSAIKGLFNEILGASLEAEQAQLRLEAMIRATGSAAGRTANQLGEMATQLMRTTQFDDEEIKQAAASLMTFRSVRKEIFDDAIKAAADVAAGRGMGIQSVAFMLGRALESPMQSMRMLRMMGISLSAAQRDQIKTMVEQGRTADAQRIVLDRLQGAFGGVGQYMNQGLTGALNQAKKSWKEFLESLGQTAPFKLVLTFLKAMTDFFNARQLTDNPIEVLAIHLNTAQERTDQLRRRLRELEDMPAAARAASPLIDFNQQILNLRQQIQRNEDEIVAPLQEELRIMRGQEEQAGRTAAAASDQQAAERAREEARAQASMAARQALEEQQKTFERIRDETQQMIAQTIQDIRRAEREDADTVGRLRAQYLRDTGQTWAAIGLEAEQEFGALLARLTMQGNQGGIELVNNIINLRYAKERMDLLTQQLDLQRQLAEAAGRPQVVAEIDIETNLLPQKARMLAAGNTFGAQLVDNMINLTRARARLQEMQSAFEANQQTLTARLQEIDMARQQGLITQNQAAEQQRAIYEQQIVAVEQNIAAYEEYNASLETMGYRSVEVDSKVAGLRQQLMQLRGSLNNVKTTMDELVQRAAVEWRQSLTNIVVGFIEAGEISGNAWKKMARDIIDALKRIAAQMLATLVIQKLLGDPKSAGGGGVLSFLFAAGGPVVGPGTPESDSVPARLSTGEYVMNAQAVQKWGVGFLNAVNYGTPPTRTGTVMNRVFQEEQRSMTTPRMVVDVQSRMKKGGPVDSAVATSDLGGPTVSQIPAARKTGGPVQVPEPPISMMVEGGQVPPAIQREIQSRTDAQMVREYVAERESELRKEAEIHKEIRRETLSHESSSERVVDRTRELLSHVNLREVRQRVIYLQQMEQLIPSVREGTRPVVKMARGGLVTGPGTSTSDSISTRLSKGEYVIKADAVREWGVSFLDALNQGALPTVRSRKGSGFADGGLVTSPQGGPPGQGDTFQANFRIDAQSLDPRTHRELLEAQAPTFFRMMTRFVRESRGFKEAMRNG